MTDPSTCPLCGFSDEARLGASQGSRLVRCKSCRLTYQDPRPSVEMVRAYYDQNIYVDPKQSDHIDQRRRTLFVDFLERVQLEGHGRLLDVGCGTGEFLQLAKAKGWNAYGVEVSLEAVEVANRHGLPVYLGNLPDQGRTDLSFPDQSFDMVTLWNVLDVFPRPVDQIREVCRILVPGGRVFIRTPNECFHLAAYRLSRLFPWPQAFVRLMRDAYIFHPLLWSPRSIRLLLQRVGFAGINIWNSPLSGGDPYRVVREERENLVRLIKNIVYGVAQVASACSGSRLLIGSSISILARKAK